MRRNTAGPGRRSSLTFARKRANQESAFIMRARLFRSKNVIEFSNVFIVRRVGSISIRGPASVFLWLSMWLRRIMGASGLPVTKKEPRSFSRFLQGGNNDDGTEKQGAGGRR